MISHVVLKSFSILSMSNEIPKYGAKIPMNSIPLDFSIPLTARASLWVRKLEYRVRARLSPSQKVSDHVWVRQTLKLRGLGVNRVGKKFAQVELVASLVMIVREWKIELVEGWNERRVWEVINRSGTVITLAPSSDVPLLFKKRSQI